MLYLHDMRVHLQGAEVEVVKDDLGGQEPEGVAKQQEDRVSGSGPGPTLVLGSDLKIKSILIC
jgi:hypothetical protein